MLPARSFAMPPEQPIAASRRRGVAILSTAVVVLAAVAYAGGLLFPATSSAVIFWSMAVLYGLGVVGLLRANRRKPLPVAISLSPARRAASVVREPAAEIRCNPFFELLSSPSL